jgi:Tfp pilus assembly protein PilP
MASRVMDDKILIPEFLKNGETKWVMKIKKWI